MPEKKRERDQDYRSKCFLCQNKDYLPEEDLGFF